MTFLFGFCIIAALFATPLVIYRKFYWKRVAAITVLSEGKYCVCSYLPTTKVFKMISSGSKFSFVALGSGYFALYVPCITEEDRKHLHYKELTFNGNVLIFKRNRFGRFVSVDLSNRIVFDILSKFN